MHLRMNHSLQSRSIKLKVFFPSNTGSKHRVTAPTVLRGAGLVWRAMKMRTQYWIGTICLILMAWIIFFTLMWAPR
jgi:hypothetical protein